ncbi:MAG: hypothetical protein FWD49_06700 [Firmicutes bacterium]|nr:hypothetical protein [Bacillota bacterium]
MTNLSHATEKILKMFKIDLKKEKDPVLTYEERRANSALTEMLREIERNYQSTLTKKAGDSGYSTNEQLLEKAESELIRGLTERVDKASSTAEGKLEKISVKQSEAEISEKAELDRLQSQLENLLNKQANSMVKQGLARSTIFSEGVNALESANAKNAENLNLKYSLKIEGLTLEAERVKYELDSALKSYEIKYASDLEKRYQNLIKERDTLLDRENAQILKDANERSKKYGPTRAEQNSRQEIYNTAYGFYSQLDKPTARALIKNNYGALHGLMGAELAQKLLKQFG